MTEAEKERAAVLYFITCTGCDHPRHGWPFWKLFVWGIFHPFQLREVKVRLQTLDDMYNAIQSGEHLKEGR